jgi:hypothetical protein
MMLSDSTSYKSPPSKLCQVQVTLVPSLDIIDNIMPNIANGVEEEES